MIKTSIKAGLVMNNNKILRAIVILFFTMKITFYGFAFAQGLSWNNIPKLSLGKLKVFWNVSDSSRGLNSKIAKEHGFHGVAIVNTYSDYPGEQKESIQKWLPDNYSNPWIKPSFFKKIISRNINNTKPDEIYVHDIEAKFEGDPQKAWLATRANLNSNDREFIDYQNNYFKALAEWFYLPLIWTKQIYPGTKVGLYGIQPFRRDYWGLVNKSVLEIDGAHAYDKDLWKYIEEYVDFYISSVYLFYNTPDSYYYIMANIENNFQSTRNFGNKPVYAYEWMRYHSTNELLANQEVSSELVEAMAILPFFSGAKGLVLWGWEPQITQIGDQPYVKLEQFVNTLKRLEPLSTILSDGKLIIDQNASELWKTKQPIVRRVENSKSECVLMAVNPWQISNQTSSVFTKCGSYELTIKIKANHITLVSVKNGNIRYH